MSSFGKWISHKLWRCDRRLTGTFSAHTKTCDHYECDKLKCGRPPDALRPDPIDEEEDVKTVVMTRVRVEEIVNRPTLSQLEPAPKFARAVEYPTSAQTNQGKKIKNLSPNKVRSVIVKCAVCGTQMERAEYEIKRSKTGIFFCSREHQTDYQRHISRNRDSRGKVVIFDK